MASGKKVILIYTDKTYKIYNIKDKKDFKKLELKPLVKYILTSSMSVDCYERLYSKAKNKKIDEVIKNYKKYFIYKISEKMLSL